MRRSDLEHILRAVRDIANRPAFLVIGSQSVLGTWTEAELPPEATMSAEVDLAPITELDRTRLTGEVRQVLAQTYPDDLDAGVDPQTITDSLDIIGEFSTFHESFDVYVQGVGYETATLPSGWESRLVALTNSATGYAVGLCLDPVDACCAKLVAGRENDYIFVAALIEHGLVDPADLTRRVDLLPPSAPRASMARSWARAQTRTTVDGATPSLDSRTTGPHSPSL